jgi:hypothetical protein
MSGSGGGMTTGPGGTGGGFGQSSNPFGGLTNTDLRPGRRSGDVRRRRIPLLNTSWVTRNKEPAMRKDVASLVDTLRDSVTGIVASGTPDMDERLSKSFSEFGEALGGQLEAEYGADPEPIGEGLDHIALFAHGLAKMADSVAAIKGDEEIPLLDRYLDHGVLVLRQLVNDTAELPEDDQDVGRAEASGELVKIEGSWGELLVKTALPEEYTAYLTEPLDVLTAIAGLGASLVEDARDIADEMLKQDPEAIPLELVDALPLVFEPLDKAAPPFPPKRRAADEVGRNLGRGDAADEGSDTGDDTGDDAGAVDQAGPADDMPQNPVETITRLASIIVVIAGSLQQAMGQTGDVTAPGAGGDQADIRNVGLQRGEPLLDQPLAKILAGEAEINMPGLSDMSLSEAIEQLSTMQKQMPRLQKQLGEKDQAFEMLKARYEALAGQPAPPRGAAKTVAVSKSEDGVPAGAVTTEGDVTTLEKLAKQDSEGGAAAKFLIGRVHQAGGTPLVPPG